MLYQEIQLEAPTTIDNYISSNNLEHMKDMRQINLSIYGIAESYCPKDSNDATTILTDKGYFYVKIAENLYHEYYLFKNPDSAEFKHVLVINEPVDKKSPSYENIHRIILIRSGDSHGDPLKEGPSGSEKYYYTFKILPIQYGKEGNKYVFRADIDGFSSDGHDFFPDDDGLFRTTTAVSSIPYMLLSYKQFIYFKPHISDKSKIKICFRNLARELLTNNSVYKYDDENFYIDGSTDDNDEGLLFAVNDEDEYLRFSIETTREDSDSALNSIPEQILLEVY